MPILTPEQTDAVLPVENARDHLLEAHHALTEAIRSLPPCPAPAMAKGQLWAIGNIRSALQGITQRLLRGD